MYICTCNTPEIWKPLPRDKKRMYSISNRGRIRSRYYYTPIFRAQRSDSKGYYRVNISIAGRIITVHTHVLVAETFIGPTPTGKEINHIDKNVGHNCAENLEYVTHAENMKHFYGHVPYRLEDTS